MAWGRVFDRHEPASSVARPMNRPHPPPPRTRYGVGGAQPKPGDTAVARAAPAPPPTRFGGAALQQRAEPGSAQGRLPAPGQRIAIAPPPVRWPSPAAQPKAAAGPSPRPLTAPPTTQYGPAAGPAKPPASGAGQSGASAAAQAVQCQRASAPPSAPAPAATGGRAGAPVAQPLITGAIVAGAVLGVAALALGVRALVRSYNQARQLIATAPAYLQNVSTATVMFGGHGLVRALYALFRQHYAYSLVNDYVDWGGAGNIDANCHGLSIRFVADLQHFGLNAATVRVANGHHFLVRCPDFIDNAVPGPIYYNGNQQNAWYLFDSHYAVRYDGLYYDTMAGRSYANFVSDIDLAVVSDMAHGPERIVVFRNAAGGAILHGQNRLVMDLALNEPGDFNRSTLVNAGANYMASSGMVVIP